MLDELHMLQFTMLVKVIVFQMTITLWALTLLEKKTNIIFICYTTVVLQFISSVLAVHSGKEINDGSDGKQTRQWNG